MLNNKISPHVISMERALGREGREREIFGDLQSLDT